MLRYNNFTIQILTYIRLLEIQWGSEIRPFEIRKHLKSGLFEGRISNGWAPNYLKTETFKIGTFVFGFKSVLKE